ncbi:hypothetical protein [Natronobiforma cellulositropha]|uniref:hypothetical protein n=1 Tax=Natronobiforma cellulositropha TaxID=1679076 RepID=UPI0021D5F42A|nr:hypothetical protein [Natronobiforma cellulositropha]
MTGVRTHLVSLVPPALLAVILGFHPAYLLAMVAGVLLPTVDALDERLHRSWLFHTFLVPAILYELLVQSGVDSALPAAVVALHFLTIGMLFHFVFDFVYPKEMSHEGTEWPVQPTIWSAPWGLFWLGLAWLFQWFVYLAPAFLPWLVTSL